MSSDMKDTTSLPVDGNPIGSSPPISLLDHCEPIFVEYNLIREFNLFTSQEIPNVYVIPASSTPHKWFGVMFIHDGLYQGAILKFTLVIPAKFFQLTSETTDRPRLYFDPIPFHPLIHPQTGELNTHRAIPAKWRVNVNHLWQLILYAKKVFYNIESEFASETNLAPPQDIADKISAGHQNSLDVLFYNNAIRMLREDWESFCLKVEESKAESHARQYDNPSLWECDPHAFTFGPWNATAYEPLRRRIMNGNNPLDSLEGSTGRGGSNHHIIGQLGDLSTGHVSNVGLSWVGSDGKSFSKPANSSH